VVPGEFGKERKSRGKKSDMAVMGLCFGNMKKRRTPRKRPRGGSRDEQAKEARAAVREFKKLT